MASDWDSLFSGISTPSGTSGNPEQDTLIMGEGGYAGWYGKLPALGDFASRRLDDEFIRVWDDWLQRGVGTLRNSLGEDTWLDAYLAAPIWNFALFPGVLHPSLGFAGVLMSSADRVGRYFPLTLCTPVSYPQQLALELESGTRWYADLREIALGALAPEMTPEGLDERLADLGLGELNRPAMPANYELAQAISQAGAGSATSARLSTPLSAAILPSQRAFLQQSFSGLGLWWTEIPGTPSAPGQTLCFTHRDVMTPDQYLRMATLDT
jgi:type VI secretion system protein ImpM